MLLDLHEMQWRIINDGVMGGLSCSSLDRCDPGLLFQGELSTENRGGFVSFLAPLAREIANPAGFRLAASGDGRRYQLRLRETEASRDVAWRAFFIARDEPITIDLALEEFQPVIRGQPAIGARPLGLTPVRYIGFMLVSRRPGPFRLRIHSVEVLGNAA